MGGLGGESPYRPSAAASPQKSRRGTVRVCSNPVVWVSGNKTVRAAGGGGQLTEGPGEGRVADVSPETSTACVVPACARSSLGKKNDERERSWVVCEQEILLPHRDVQTLRSLRAAGPTPSPPNTGTELPPETARTRTHGCTHAQIRVPKSTKTPRRRHRCARWGTQTWPLRLRTGPPTHRNRHTHVHAHTRTPGPLAGESTQASERHGDPWGLQALPQLLPPPIPRAPCQPADPPPCFMAPLCGTSCRQAGDSLGSQPHRGRCPGRS